MPLILLLLPALAQGQPSTEKLHAASAKAAEVEAKLDAQLVVQLQLCQALGVECEAPPEPVSSEGSASEGVDTVQEERAPTPAPPKQRERAPLPAAVVPPDAWDRKPRK